MTDQSQDLYNSFQSVFRAFRTAASGGLEHEAHLAQSDIAVLTFVGDHPGCILTDVAEALSIGMTTASSVVDRLAKKGLLDRERSEENRRIVVLNLTGEGQHLRSLSLGSQMTLCRQLLEALSPAERPYFARLLAKASDSVEHKARPTVPKTNLY